MSDEQKRPLADTNCRGVDGDVGEEGGGDAKSEERKREIAGRRGGG